jgi:hypothetical protein
MGTPVSRTMRIFPSFLKPFASSLSCLCHCHHEDLNQFRFFRRMEIRVSINFG